MKIGRLLLLASLAASAYYAPRVMSVFPSGAGSGPTDILHGLQQLQFQSQSAGGGSAPEVGFGQMIEATGSNPNAPSVDFQQLMGAAERESASVPSEGTELTRGLKEIADSGALKAPLLQKLVQDYQQKQDQVRSLRDRVWDAWLFAQRWYRDNRREVDLVCWTVPWVLFLLSLVTFTLSHAGFARQLGELGYGLSRNWLRILSLAVIAISLSTHSNPWPLIPRTLILAPTLWLLASAYTLHLVDMNYPFWNSTLKGCLSPLVSMALIVLIQKAPLFFPG